MKDAYLAIELSTARGSVAVAAGGEVLFETEFGAGRSHNALLFEPLGLALEKAGKRLAGIVVGTGPGSYTGVRIAIAAAHGVALSRQVPVAGVSSLLACGAVDDYGVIGDARRGRLYVAEVRDGVLVEPIRLMPPDQVPVAMETAALPLWLSCDETPPLAGLALAQPCARHLALMAAAGRVDWQSEQPLQPHYLEGAFITTARKKTAL